MRDLRMRLSLTVINRRNLRKKYAAHPLYRLCDEISGIISEDIDVLGVFVNVLEVLSFNVSEANEIKQVCKDVQAEQKEKGRELLAVLVCWDYVIYNKEEVNLKVYNELEKYINHIDTDKIYRGRILNRVKMPNDDFEDWCRGGMDDVKTILQDINGLVAPVSGTDAPKVTDEQINFFCKKIELNYKTYILPAHKILGAIWSLTREWKTTDTRKWRVLYEVLERKKYFERGKRKQYKPFVENVVLYCMPDVDENKCSGNISKIIIPDEYVNWSKEDSQLFQNIAGNLNQVILTSANS